MQTPQFLLDLLQLLLDLAAPAAFCTLAAAGVSLRHEGGINFHVNGRTGKWIMWTVVLSDTAGTAVVDRGTRNQYSLWQRIGGYELARQHGDSLQKLRQPDRRRQAGPRFGSLLRPEGHARWSHRREPARISRRGSVPDVTIGNHAALSGMELGRRVRNDRHAHLPLELHRRSNHAGRGGTGVCRSSHQLRPAQTLDQAGLRRDFFPLCERPSFAFQGDGGLRSNV